MRRHTFLGRFLALAAVLALVAAACKADTTTPETTEPTGTEGPVGGSLVVGAEQWPKCINLVVTSCASLSWAAQSVSYHLTPDAVWDDGSPITCEDWDFTWRAFLNTKGTYYKVGYDQIESIDCSDSLTAVLNFKTTYADWPALFGGAFEFVMEKAAFPDADPEKPDLSGDMVNEIPFSGGPWILESWSEQEAVLVRNDSFWVEDRIPPLDDPVVREALLFALDRQAVLDALIKLNNPDAELVNCPQYIPGLWPWCQPVFEDVTYDPAHAIELLEGAGWDCSGVPDAPCEKDGQPLVLTISANTGNTRREAAQQIFKEAAKPAGFELDIENYGSGVYFGRVCPRGLVHVCDYASAGTPAGTILFAFGCDYLPTEENEYAGGNWNHYCNPENDALMKELDAEVDTAKRIELATQVQEILREDAVSL